MGASSVRAGKAALHDPSGEGNVRLRSSKETPWPQQSGRGRRGENEPAEATTCSWTRGSSPGSRGEPPALC